MIFDLQFKFNVILDSNFVSIKLAENKFYFFVIWI